MASRSATGSLAIAAPAIAVVPARRGRGRPLVDDKRRRILDAAIVVFAHRGYHGTSVPDVATAAQVSTGTLYHYFEHKEQLVNEVYRDAKRRLGHALLDDLPTLDVDAPGGCERWFLTAWDRLSAFGLREPEAFRFLEMQDHVEYLDAETRALELSVIAPIYAGAQRMNRRGKGARVDLTVAMVWGAFVGLFKVGRAGYVKIDAPNMRAAGEICWRMLAATIGPAGAPKPLKAARRRPSRARSSAKAGRTRRAR